MVLMLYALYVYRRRGEQMIGQYELTDVDEDINRLIQYTESIRSNAKETGQRCGALGHTAILPVEAGKPIPSEVYEE